MRTGDAYLPDYLPVLSRGRHRSARQGGCFMEFASFLAGERWSDHPSCTHPLLATLARLVNDHISDAGRQRLVPLIPSVIGSAVDDVRIDLRIALRSALTALPVVAEERQRSMAVSVLVANRLLAEVDGRAPDDLDDRSRQALAAVPHAAAWAPGAAARVPASLRTFRRRGAPATVAYAVDGIATACVPEPDEILRGLLAGAIADCPHRDAAPAVREPGPEIREIATLR